VDTTQITGAFDKMSVEDKSKTKTRGFIDAVGERGKDLAVQLPDLSASSIPQPIIVDQRTHKVFKVLFYTPTYNTGDLSKAVKWVEFKRAMARVGFSIEKLQGSAWQFTPDDALQLSATSSFTNLTLTAMCHTSWRSASVGDWRVSTAGAAIHSSLLELTLSLGHGVRREGRSKYETGEMEEMYRERAEDELMTYGCTIEACITYYM
jgi:hypothetical protein